MGPRPINWPASQLMGAIQPNQGPNAANTMYVTSVGLEPSPRASATVDGGYGQRPSSFTVQEESRSAVSTTIGQPPGGHAHPPLNIASPHPAAAAAQGASMVEPHFGKTTTTPDPTIPRDPPKSTTKGRAKLKIIESTLELHPKRKNKCSYCGSVNHNGAQCQTRLV
ncbi:Protein FAR-RED ELONGATED HYPOCOTYL 3 [Hordeum vulgare]|nr:Protein FAR-RED ELONGATED HYPOCOTYL 3 [Hordeum vulgare]